MCTPTSTHNLAAHACVAVLRPALTRVIPDVISLSGFCLRKCDRAMKLWLLRQRAGQIWLVMTGKDTHIHKHTHTCVYPDSTWAFIRKRMWLTHVDQCLMWLCFYSLPRKEEDGQLTSDGGYKGRRGEERKRGRQEMNGGGTGGSGVSLLMWHGHI